MSFPILPRPVKAKDPELAFTTPGEVAAPVAVGSLTDLVTGAGALVVTVLMGAVVAGVTVGDGLVAVVVGGTLVGGIGVVVGGGGGFFDGGPPPTKVIGIDGRSWAASRKRSEQVKPAVC
jgi:hypothetical protein